MAIKKAGRNLPKEKDAVFDPKQFDRLLGGGGNRLEIFRTALKQGREALTQSYLNDARSHEIIKTHAWLIDQLIVRVWKHHLTLLPKETHAALVAVGGYGRGELHPASDIDLMLLLEKDSHKQVSGFFEALLHFFWDMGLEVGHSVRSLKDCVREGKKDITIATNLMEARLLQGDAGLFKTMQTTTRAPKIWPSKQFFAAKRQEQIERHHRFDDTAYNLEPNIKEGPGGLRDIQMIGWVTQRHFGADSLHDLVKLKFLSEKEYRALIHGRDFLWQIRNGLHYLAGRREDRLLFDHQRALAQQMGYANKPGSLAVEQFMKLYYRTVKELALLNEILLQHFQEAILAPRKPKEKPINRRFKAYDDFIEATHLKVFEHSPFAMLEIFLLLQQNPKLKGVRASTIRLLHANLHRIDGKFRKDIACRSLFMEMMRQPRGITHELRRMNAYGVLGAYIPAFGKVVGQMQHDLFHVYTVDAHSLFVVRNLRRLTVPEFKNELPLASAIIQQLAKPERLYLAGLFHDIAKGRGGDHSELGEKEARAFCKLHGLSDYDTRLVCWLVRNHLIMSMTAQREDISDPEVVLRFAKKVGDQEHLNNLYLLTAADMRGTSPKVWNAWKGKLLSQLYADTLRVLRRGFGAPIDMQAHIADLRTEALALLESKSIPSELIDKHWQHMDNDYFLRHDVESLAWHAEIIAPASASDLPLVAARYRPDWGGSEFLIFTPDREDLFVVLTGGFDRLNLSIMDARIHTTRFGFALDTFIAFDLTYQAISDVRVLSQLQSALREQLLSPRPGRNAAAVHLPRQLKHFPIETKVSFSPSSNGQLTLMEVTAQDRPGLLYQVALSLQHCKARLVTAKVATYGERAEDIFFITDRNGRPVTDDKQLYCLASEVYQRLAPTAEKVVGLD